jgi:hypothetical protein
VDSKSFHDRERRRREEVDVEATGGNRKRLVAVRKKRRKGKACHLREEREGGRSGLAFQLREAGTSARRLAREAFQFVLTAGRVSKPL